MEDHNNNNPGRLIHEIEYYLGNTARVLEQNGLYNLTIACDNVIANFHQPEFENLYQQFLNDLRNLSQEDKENVKATMVDMLNNHAELFMYDVRVIFNVDN